MLEKKHFETKEKTVKIEREEKWQNSVQRKGGCK